MSEAEKPEVPSTQPAPNRPPPEPPRRERPPREKPQRFAVGGSQQPRSLEHEQTYGFGKKIDAFDDDMERQLQEAMGGATLEAQLGEPMQYGKRGQPAPEGPKKGKVFRVHGQDVFIDLPGGRSQGVMQI